MIGGRFARYAVAMSFILMFGLIGGKAVSAKDEAHLVNISVDGQSRSFPTTVTTVGKIIEKAGITIAKEDLVEPALDTPILEDSFNINIYRARPVIIVKDDKQVFKLTAYQSPRQIAQSAGFIVNDEDGLTMSQIDNIVDQGTLGERLVISPSKEVHINLYGTDVTVHTQKTTVSELLKDKNISYDAKDQITPSLDSPLTNGLSIYITRQGTKIESTEEVVPFPVETITDANMFVSQSRIESKGINGKKVVTYEITTSNGAESARRKIQEIVIAEPVKQVVVKGTKPIELRANVAADKQKIMAAAGLPESDWAGADYIISHESGWCATKWQGSRVCPTEFIPNGGGPGYGLCQSTPATKMASAGPDWQTNPITQLNWCTSYARARYGGWPQAYTYWLSHRSW